MKTHTQNGYHSMNSHLVFQDAKKAIDFYQKAFGARERYRLVEPSGKLGHAELEIGDTVFSMADEYPDFGALSPASIGGCPVKFQLYVQNADAAMKQALSAGASEVRAVKDEFYGDRVGMVADPFGYTWSLAQHIEDITPEEMQKRFAAVLAG